MINPRKKSKYWVDDSSILPEIIITPQGNYPILDETGNPARTVGAIQDINPNAHIYERVNTQPFMDDYIEGETNATANQRADSLDVQVVPHMGDFVGAAIKPLDVLIPSRWVGLLDKDYDGLSAVDRFSRLFDENNRGLFINDNPYGLFSKRYAEEHPYLAAAGNMAFDVASTPFIINKAKEAYNAGKTAVKNASNAMQFLNSPYTGKWTRFGNREYRFKPGYIGMNGVSIESRVAESAKVPWSVASYPGYQLKGLMNGSQLERQISKNGTISIDQLNAFFNKTSKTEKEIVNKVLAEKFAGQKTIDYNQFKKAVQDELVTYDRIPSDKWADYGTKGLGFKTQMDSDAQSIRFNEETGEFEQIAPFEEFTPDYTLNTYTFESPRIPVGNNSHYNSGTLGHSRTYTTADEPDVLHVMESQSDWGQKPLGLTKNEKAAIKNIDEQLQSGTPTGFSTLEELQAQKQAILDRASRRTSQNSYQARHLHDNYLQRQLQENLRYAAEQDQTKMRYPTSETAAKIEGYESYPKVLQDEELEKLLSEDPEYMQLYKDLTNAYKGRDNVKIQDIHKRIMQKRNDVRKAYGETHRGYDPKHQTILKKYEDFPKLFKKLYKDSDVRIVTDSKGNTWYEVDVPENYLNQEWQYKYGGKVILPPWHK